MVEERDADEEKFADSMKGLRDEIDAALAKKDKNWEEVKTIKANMEMVQTIHSEKTAYPTWPFDRGILLKFSIVQIISIGSLLLQKIPDIENAVKALLGSIH